MASESKINEAIAILLAAYPATGQKSTMGPFLTLVSKTLQPYANEVLLALVDPRRGIVAESKFFPSLAEIKIFCDRHQQQLLEAHYRERQDEERRNALPPPPVDPRVQKVISAGLRDLARELAAPDRQSLMTVEEERQKAERWLAQQSELVKTQPKIKISERLYAAIYRGENHAD